MSAEDVAEFRRRLSITLEVFEECRVVMKEEVVAGAFKINGRGQLRGGVGFNPAMHAAMVWETCATRDLIPAHWAQTWEAPKTCEHAEVLGEFYGYPEGYEKHGPACFECWKRSVYQCPILFVEGTRMISAIPHHAVAATFYAAAAPWVEQVRDITIKQKGEGPLVLSQHPSDYFFTGGGAFEFRTDDRVVEWEGPERFSRDKGRLVATMPVQLNGCKPVLVLEKTGEPDPRNRSVLRR